MPLIIVQTKRLCGNVRGIILGRQLCTYHLKHAWLRRRVNLVADLCHESEKGQLSIVGRLLACDRKQGQAGRARLGYESAIDLEADLAVFKLLLCLP